jgi:hypothetical protein
MQDDPENGRCWVGMPLGNADQDAECRGSDPFANYRVFEGQRDDRGCRPTPCRSVRLGAEDTGCPGVCAARQKAPRRDPGILEQSDGSELGPDHASDSVVYTDWSGGVEGVSAALLCRQVHACGCGATGRSGPCSRAVERAGDLADCEARVQRIREPEVRAPGGGLGAALRRRWYGRDLGMLRQPGHRFFFSAEEIEPIP